MRKLTVVAVLLVVATLPLPAAAAGLNVSVAAVTVSPQEPEPGEAVTITPTVRNLQGSSDALKFEAIALRRSGNGINEYTRVEDLGTLSPGSSLDVPLTVTFDNEGTKNLRVIVFGHPPDKPTETVRIRYPVTISVKDRSPQLDISTNDSINGIESDGTVTVANGLNTDLSNVEVSISGLGIEMIEKRSVLATLEAGDTATVPFTFRPETPGPHGMTATLTYTVDGDTQRTTTRTTTIQTEPLQDSVVLEPTPAASGADLTVSVVNEGNAQIENVVVTGDSSNATLQRALVSSLSAGTSTTVQLNTTLQQPPAKVDVTATYDVGTAQKQVTASTTLQATPGAITLTGIDVTREDGRIRISGSASNVGTSDADSVLVSVQNTAAVDPAFPNKEYFVGTVPASDFVSFDVYAQTAENTSSVPLEVTYLVDGDREQQTFRIDIAESEPNTNQQPSDPSGLQSTVALGIGGIVTFAVGVIIVIGWRASRDDN